MCMRPLTACISRFCGKSIDFHFEATWTTPSMRCPDMHALDGMYTGCVEAFIGAAALHAMGTAIIGQSPAAYAADVMPSDAAGLGLGIYRCAGDLGVAPPPPPPPSPITHIFRLSRTRSTIARLGTVSQSLLVHDMWQCVTT